MEQTNNLAEIEQELQRLQDHFDASFEQTGDRAYYQAAVFVLFAKCAMRLPLPAMLATARVLANLMASIVVSPHETNAAQN